MCVTVLNPYQITASKSRLYFGQEVIYVKTRTKTSIRYAKRERRRERERKV